jgi:hypothetical protein
MAQATSTTFGEIKLAGDLAGSTDASSPQLTATGVTAGQYALPTITVDSKGRISHATAGTSNGLVDLIPAATTTQKGIAKIGQNIQLTTVKTVGSIVVDFGGSLVGANVLGLCANSPSYSLQLLVDGTIQSGITVQSGQLSTVNDLIAAFNAAGFIAELFGGNIRFKSATQGAGSSVRIQSDALLKYIPGYVAILPPVDGMDETTIYLNDASTTQKGVVKLGSGFTVDSNGTANFDITSVATASTSAKGVVQIATNGGLSITNGILSATAIPDATTISKGIVQIGQNLTVSNGVVSVPYASASVAGAFKVGYGLAITDGVLGLDMTKVASTTQTGLVRIGSGLTVTNGIISAGSNIASASNIGAVKIGSGVSVTGDGTISVTAGSVPDATYSSKGQVQIGSNITVTNGTISIAAGSSSTLGVVKINTTLGLSVTNGVLSANLADGTNLGLVRISNTNNLVATAGYLDVGTNIPKRDAANTFSKAQVVSMTTAAFASTITLDLSLSNSFMITAAGNFTLANPTNVVPGGVYYIIVNNSGGYSITWGSNFKFRGFTPTLLTGVNIISVMAVGGSFLATEVFSGY